MNGLIAAIDWQGFLEIPEFVQFVRICLLSVIILAVLWIISFALTRVLVRTSSLHYRVLVRKLIFYSGAVILGITILLELGFNLTGLLATAGIATVAIGFAAQTSLGNIISGLFLIGEKPFQIGDLVRVNDILGIVESIELLSVKIRTLDNLFVRIPNETMLKNPVTTVTRYPIRRMDLEIGVAYKEDVARVMEILKELAEKNPLVMDNPEPLILFNRFGDSALELKYGLWFEKSNYLALRNSIMKEIKERFDQEGIEIPFPHLSLYSGSESAPIPVDINPKSSD